MTTRITIEEVVELIKQKDNIYILTHKSPDGDTLGSAYALCMALRKLSKNVNVLIEGELPDRFRYLFRHYRNMYFDPEYIISVDVASPALLGDSMKEYKNKVDLCIDHHMINNIDAKYSCIDSTAAAAAEIVYDLIIKAGIPVDKKIATGIYTGISTDTGCFCFSNTTPKIHIIASEVMPYCDWTKINQINFGIKSRARIKLEQMVYETLEYIADGLGALIYITQSMLNETGAKDDDVEGIPSLPRSVEGVVMGITMKEKEDGAYRISVRTNGEIDAARYCMQFNGGGHIGAAGCTLEGSFDEVKNRLIKTSEDYINACTSLKI